MFSNSLFICKINTYQDNALFQAYYSIKKNKMLLTSNISSLKLCFLIRIRKYEHNRPCNNQYKILV